MRRLLVEPKTNEAIGRCRALVFLVGGYDGSGNYGDLIQLEAALRLVRHLGQDVLPVPVLESACAGCHADLAARAPGLVSAVAYYDDAEDENGVGAGLVPISLDRLQPALVYLYGGGYVNALWGERKLGMVEAVDDLVRRCDLPLAALVSSGLQIEPGYLQANGRAWLLERLGLIGVRDEESLAAVLDVAASGLPERPLLVTGDDAFGVIDGWPRPPRDVTHDRDSLRVNVHLSVEPWVTGDPDWLLAYLLDALAALGARTGGIDARVVSAYEDRRVSDSVAARRLIARARESGLVRVRSDVLRLQPPVLESALDELGSADLTISCSYHVALTSLALGVPAALVTAVPYYRQKGAGLREDFGLPDAFLLDPASDPAEAAAAIHAHLGDSQRHLALRAELAARRDRLTARRRDAELQVLGSLAEALVEWLGAPAFASEQDGDDAGLAARLAAQEQVLEQRARLVVDLVLELSTMRRTHLEAVASARDARRSLQAGEERIACIRAELEALDERLALAEQRLEVVHESRSWRMTAPLRAAAEQARRLRAARR